MCGYLPPQPENIPSMTTATRTEDHHSMTSATRTVIDSGPFARSRNPLYLGLLAGSAGVALVAASLWALVALPLEWALLRWGAVGPEEHYLAAKFGASYADYTSRVPRWL